MYIIEDLDFQQCSAVIFQSFYIYDIMHFVEQFSMGICGCVPLEPVQEIARSLLEQLRADEYCPYELRVS